MIPRDRDAVELRRLVGTERERVRDDAHRRGRRVDVCVARDVLLQDVVLDRAAKRLARDALLVAHGDVHRQQDGRGRVDRHRRRHLVERDAVEHRRHVLDGVYRDPRLPDLAGGHRVVGVVPHLGGEVKGHRQPGLALVEQVAEPLVRLCGGSHPRVLSHRPELSPVHRRVDAAGVRLLAREPDVAFVLRVGAVGRRVQRLHVLPARVGGERLLALPEPLDGRFVRLRLPLLVGVADRVELFGVEHASRDAPEGLNRWAVTHHTTGVGRGPTPPEATYRPLPGCGSTCCFAIRSARGWSSSHRRSATSWSRAAANSSAPTAALASVWSPRTPFSVLSTAS